MNEKNDAADVVKATAEAIMAATNAAREHEAQRWKFMAETVERFTQRGPIAEVLGAKLRKILGVETIGERVDAGGASARKGEAELLRAVSKIGAHDALMEAIMYIVGSEEWAAAIGYVADLADRPADVVPSVSVASDPRDAPAPVE